jgi:hypothetical protein
MNSIEKCDVPENSLLSTYQASGAYTDCYATKVDRKILQIDYVEAFYTTLPFKLERVILKWAVSKPSTDKDARLLAEARADTFAAWTVEARRDEQILLSDFRGRTRSWLMSQPSSDIAGEATLLYFGSAVVPTCTDETEGRRMGKTFNILLEFHKLYSQLLLASARRRLAL